MLTSSCVWSLIINHTCQNWGFYTLLTCLPTYFNDVLRFDIQSVVELPCHPIKYLNAYTI